MEMRTFRRDPGQLITHRHLATRKADDAYRLGPPDTATRPSTKRDYKPKRDLHDEGPFLTLVDRGLISSYATSSDPHGLSSSFYGTRSVIMGGSIK